MNGNLIEEIALAMAEARGQIVLKSQAVPIGHEVVIVIAYTNALLALVALCSWDGGRWKEVGAGQLACQASCQPDITGEEVVVDYGGRVELRVRLDEFAGG